MRLLTVLMFCMLCMFSSVTFAASGVIPGSGTEADPWLIEDLADFQAFCGSSEMMAEDTYTTLTADIDLGDQVFSESVVPQPFFGHFDGGGHSVSNFTITGNNDGLGLFKLLSGTISGLGVKSCSITGSGHYHGALVGTISQGNIYQCFAEGVQVNGTNCVGGLVGNNYYGSVTECYTSGVEITGSSQVGGLCGMHNRGTITNCYSSGTVTGSGSIGGFCGYSDYGTITTSYSSCVVPNGYGFLGQSYGASVTNCYFYKYGSWDNSLGSDLNNSQMLLQSSYTGFNFTEVWTVENGHYPKLQYQLTNGPVSMVYQLSTTLAGSGTSDNPFLISSNADMMEFCTNASLRYGCYQMTADIDLGDQVFSESVVPQRFIGYFDGGGHSVSNFTITGNNDGLGLFKLLSGTISGLGVKSCSITGSGHYHGALVGTISQGNIYQCFAEGVQVNGTNCVGGLVGNNYYGSVTECYTSGVEITGSSQVGGLCGMHNRGTITNCYSSGTVTGSGSIGGFCGYSDYGTITTSYSSCVVPNGYGFLGQSYGASVTNCYFYKYGSWDNSLGSDLNNSQMLLQSSYTGFNFTEVWTVENGHYPKLQYQLTNGPVSMVYQLSTTLAGSGASDNPFLISSNADMMEFCTNASLRYGCYQMTADIDLGDQVFSESVVPQRFIGYFDGGGHSVSNFTITGDNSYVGLFYQLDGKISRLGVKSCTITGNGSYRGSLVGNNNLGNIYQCFAEGVQINGLDHVGGLVGNNYYGSVTECYTSEVEITGRNYVGGLCGLHNRGTITNCYSSGTVTGSGSIGGFCGYSDYGTITTSYSSCVVPNGYGFLGQSYGASVTNCFWDIDLSGQTTSAGGTGKTTEEMLTQATFLDANWNYITDETFGVWYSFENDYPRLVWEVVTVPSVEGLDYKDAVLLIADSGIRLGDISYAYSFTVPAGYVIDQDIAAGELLSHRGILNLLVSKGPELTTVPELMGLSESDAIVAITDAKLEIGDISYAYSFTVPAGYVISQSIEADLRVIINNTVDLVISDGPEYTTVPDVYGMTEAEAVLTILQAKLAIVEPIVHQYDFNVPSGHVISQSIAADESVIITTEVALVISDGPEMVGVPSLYDMNLTEAVGIIEAAELEVGEISYGYSFTVAQGNVIGQSIAGGGTTVIGSAVNLVVSDGPQIVTVPDFTGMTQAEAEAAILNAGFVVGTSMEHYSSTVPTGIVMNQDLQAGNYALIGSTIRLIISKGTKMTTVPAVTGVSQTLAEALVLAADLTVGTITTEYSMTIAEGTVIGQSLAAGNSVAVETAVDLVVSAGPEMAIVPNLALMTEDAAAAALADVKLAVGTKTYEYSFSVAEGSIVSQSVASGENVVINTAINIVISLGNMITVPDVVNMTQEDAEAAFAAIPIGISVSTDYSLTVPAGSVISQNINSGEKLLMGSFVTVVVSVGPEMTVVPNLAYITQAEAEAALENARLKLGSVSYAASYTVDIDKIISQSIRRGSSVIVGSEIDITISVSTTRIDMQTFAQIAGNWLVTVNDSATSWDIVDFNADSTIDQYDLLLLAGNWLSSDKIEVEQVEADYFETGDFTALDWQNNDPNQWNIVEEPYRGAYAAKSAVIDNMCSSSIFLTVDTTGYNSISFAAKISSEQDYDYLLFYIDGKLADYFSGEVDWSVYSYNIKTEGQHTFTWKYEKDETIGEGMDCAWIDDVVISNLE